MIALGTRLRFELPPRVGNCCSLMMDGSNLRALVFGLAVVGVIGGGLWSAATFLF
jgi:hypothetical protein